MASEFDLIARHFTRPARTAALGSGDDCAPLGIGDDCALVEAPAGLVLAVTTDMLLEGTHFLPGADAKQLGHKSLAVNLSDLAAMGADPRWFLLALSLPDADEAWLAAFAAGMFALADANAIELIGGDTTRGPRSICITAIGTLPPGCALRRDTASVGEDLWLSGSTGDAALGLAHRKGQAKLDADAAAHCLARLDAPAPRVALGTKLRGIAGSAIDVSDGLLADVGHVVEQSKVAADVEYETLPRSAALRSCADPALADECLLAGGDDYELVFTAPAARRAEVAAAGQAAGVAVTRIGSIVGGESKVTLIDAQRRPITVGRRGFDHFR